MPRLKGVVASALSLSLVALAFGQRGEDRAPQSNVNQYAAPAPLYRNSDVTKSLNLTPEEVNRLNTLTEQTQARYKDRYGKLSGLPENDRWTQYQDINRQYMNDWNKGARDILKPDQFKRYQQLNWQYGGFNSLYDPDVQKQLNLTPEQIRDLNRNAQWSWEQTSNIDRTGRTDPTKGSQAWRDYQTQYQQRFNQYLTPQQQQTWRQMTGEPYTFTPSFTPNAPGPRP